MFRKMNFLVEGQQIMRLHEKMIGEIARGYELNATELGILLFLANNPQYDTVKEIAEYRLMPKSCVSRSVDSLVKRGYLSIYGDETDRRKNHLVLEQEAAGVIQAGYAAQDQLLEQIFTGVTAEEQETFLKIHRKMLENAKEMLR